MQNKSILSGLLALILTGALGAFSWLEFFPSRYKLKLGLMLAVWALQIVALVILALQLTKGGGSGRWVALGLAGFVGLVGLVYCFASSDVGSGRGFVETAIANGNKVEIYHLDRHDHTALEVFWGGENQWLAQRYMEDDFSVESVTVEGSIVTIEKFLSQETVAIDFSEEGGILVLQQ